MLFLVISSHLFLVCLSAPPIVTLPASPVPFRRTPAATPEFLVREMAQLIGEAERIQIVAERVNAMCDGRLPGEAKGMMVS